MSVFQGREAFPPMIAKVSIKAVGAKLVKNADCIVFEPFLNPKDINFFTPESIDSNQVLFYCLKPSYLIF